MAKKTKSSLIRDTVIYQRLEPKNVCSQKWGNEKTVKNGISLYFGARTSLKSLLSFCSFFSHLLFSSLASFLYLTLHFQLLHRNPKHCSRISYLINNFSKCRIFYSRRKYSRSFSFAILSICVFFFIYSCVWRENAFAKLENCALNWVTVVVCFLYKIKR